MEYLPLFIDLKQKACLIVGGGPIALRKARLLNKANARIDVVAPTIVPELRQIVESSGGVCYQERYSVQRIDGKVFVIAATEDQAVNQTVADDVNARGLLLNVVDTPDLCNAIFPAVIDRSPLIVAVSSSGQAPVLVRAVRSQIESSVPANYGALASFIGKNRSWVKETLSEPLVRLFWEDVLDSQIAEYVLSGRETEAQALLETKVSNRAESVQGEVYLVGAGPGDPDLLTFKALRLMQRADVVLYDRLVSPAILEMTRRDAKHIYVGKARSDHAVAQEDINAMLVRLAKEGNKVVRLKGGDPFIFGRGGEEIAGLAEENIPFQIVPGITAASGCASYAGIPLTHRDHAQSVRFLTGHLKDGSIDLPWQELVHESQTLVIYMGLVGLPAICEALIQHGRSPDTPIALVEKGTTPQQKVHVASLATIVEKIASLEVHAPTLLIIGTVVSLHETLAWRDN